MPSLIDKYLKKKKKAIVEEEEKEATATATATTTATAPAAARRRRMTLCSTETTSASTPPPGNQQQGCCPPAPSCIGELASHKHERVLPNISTMATMRANFAHSIKSTIFPNTHFTNPESLPSLADALARFADAYPPYGDTQQADRIRDDDYAHLHDHVCLDYTGLSLFSHAQLHCPLDQPSSSSRLRPPFFNVSYKSTSLTSHVQYGGVEERGVEAAMRTRIMSFLNISEDDYTMVCTANRTTAFRLLAETYPFRSNKRLLTVYDYESEAASAMSDCALRRGAKLVSAAFSWPNLRIHSAKLKAVITKKRRRRGLLVFPLQSRMTGTKHPYFWMRMAQENGWHVLLDACALGAKDMDALGLSLIQPDFLICSFFKLVGEDPSGFAGLFIKKSSGAVLEASAASVGIVSLVPARQQQRADDFSGTASSVEWDSVSSLSGPMPDDAIRRFEQGETSAAHEEEDRGGGGGNKSVEIKCGGLDHADSLGLIHISCRLRCLSNWLVIALTKLQHPNSDSEKGQCSLVRIYGPRVKFERGPALAFNVFDWKGEKVEPALVQKLADRSNISLGCGFLRNIWFPEKYEEVRDAILERKVGGGGGGGDKRKLESGASGISVVNASLGFLSNFGDAYRLWSFVAKFLDADFVEKERWRYVALNQKMVEV